MWSMQGQEWLSKTEYSKNWIFRWALTCKIDLGGKGMYQKTDPFIYWRIYRLAMGQDLHKTFIVRWIIQ